MGAIMNLAKNPISRIQSPSSFIHALLSASTRAVLCSVLLLPLSGCGARFKMLAPEDFVVLEEQGAYDYRATTPDGLVIAVRDLDNRRAHGELTFWEQAIEDKLRLDQGYSLLEKKTVSTRQGKEGRQMRFGLDRDGVAHLYVVSVFVTDARVFLIETGGTEAQIQSHGKQIDWVINEFVIRRG